MMRFSFRLRSTTSWSNLSSLLWWSRERQPTSHQGLMLWNSPLMRRLIFLLRGWACCIMALIEVILVPASSSHEEDVADLSALYR